MIMFLFALSCLICAAMTAEVFKFKKTVHPIIKPMSRLFVVAIITILCNALAFVSPVEWLATLAHGLYFALTDWLVIALLDYVVKYTKINRKNTVVKVLIYGGSILDTLSMLLNMFTHHVFVSERVSVFGTEYSYVVVPRYPAYLFHLAFVYAMSLLVLALLIVRTVRSVSLYRSRFGTILYSFLAVLAVNVGYRFFDFPVDISVLFYGGLAFSIAYFTLHHVPRGLKEKLLSAALKDMDSGILCFDRDGKCIYANDRVRQLFGIDAGSLGALEGYYKKWAGERAFEEIENTSWREERGSGEDKHYCEVVYKRTLDNKGYFTGGCFSVIDRTQEELKLERERYRALHDPLTKIYNRLGFFEKVREILTASPEEPRCIVCSDIKDFKLVNELFGTWVGDEILMRIAQIISSEAGEGTVFGRLNGDRFAICMLRSHFREDMFLQYIEEVTSLAQNDVYRMHVQLGVYNITDPEMEVSVMCDRALTAIRGIKNSYEEIIAYYDESYGEEQLKEKMIIGEFDRAIEEGQFTIFLQPQISAETGVLLGAEALVRWIHPQRGLVPPIEFIPVFERAGLIHRLDRHVWELACDLLARWKERGRDDLHISVNISPKDFYYIDIYEEVTELVAKYGIDSANLKLEITETAVMTELKQQMGILERLRKYGFCIEIDDFGSGYSSLNTLKDMNVDVLKLDMGFLSETTNSERSRTIMNMVILMSKKLGLTVVSEGVETQAQVEYLTDAGCDVFQGYYFSKPMRIEDFEEKYM